MGVRSDDLEDDILDLKMQIRELRRQLDEIKKLRRELLEEEKKKKSQPYEGIASWPE